VKIDVTLGALNFLRSRGGELYLWVDVNPDTGGGTVRVSHRAPKKHHDFVRYQRPGFDVYREASMPAPTALAISLGRWPRAYLRVKVDGLPASLEAAAYGAVGLGLELLLYLAALGLSLGVGYEWLLAYLVYGAFDLLWSALSGTGRGEVTVRDTVAENPLRYLVAVAALVAVTVLFLR
jgi:hypothetical protein